MRSKKTRQTPAHVLVWACALGAVAAVPAAALEPSLRGEWRLGPPKVERGAGHDRIANKGKVALRDDRVCIRATLSGLKREKPTGATLYRSRSRGGPAVVAVWGDPHVDQKDGTRWDFKSCEPVSESAARRLVRRPSAHFVRFETTNYPEGLFQSRLQAPNDSPNDS